MRPSTALGRVDGRAPRMTRGLGIAAGTACLLLGIPWVAACQKAPPVAPPERVLLVSIDTSAPIISARTGMRADLAELDAFAKQGTVFEDVTSTAPCNSLPMHHSSPGCTRAATASPRRTRGSRTRS